MVRDATVLGQLAGFFSAEDPQGPIPGVSKAAGAAAAYTPFDVGALVELTHMPREGRWRVTDRDVTPDGMAIVAKESDPNRKELVWMHQMRPASGPSTDTCPSPEITDPG